jgi:hypothetical protein
LQPTFNSVATSTNLRVLVLALLSIIIPATAVSIMALADNYYILVTESNCLSPFSLRLSKDGKKADLNYIFIHILLHDTSFH